MLHTDIYKKRIRQFIDRVLDDRYGDTVPLSVVYTYNREGPIPYTELEKRSWKPISTGTTWGELWASAWFRVTGEVPAEFSGKHVVALVNLGSEGCIFVNGSPVQGLTNADRTPTFSTGKRRINLFPTARGGEPVELLIEAAANGLFGYHSDKKFVFDQAELAVFEPEIWQIGLDLEYLYGLALALPADSVRARRILRGLNDAANAWADGAGADSVSSICRALMARKAVGSATTVWSVGHAHLDLGWLWPVWESRRKAGRTFSTALMLLEEYPDFVFGASQPQQYQWVKEDYPQLYKRIKKAIEEGRWEPQGAMWVEPDMNIPAGESFVRQLLYGKRFFRDEFGYEVKNLWLPDVFGYSASLPQILKLAGVDFFTTQKISWNESNLFPHHSFLWEGIDGTRIRTHFLPYSSYNATNRPAEMIAGERAFTQADVSDDWLNLYGIGDGGGGPSRYHIEMARRGANTEGSPKMKLARADEFFKRLAKLKEDDLPLWRGELYLELHRGTYTTQARMKRYNRLLELRIRDAEMLAALAGLDQQDQMERIWKDTLLNQFHDILPGSSIKLVYDEAHRQSEEHLAALEKLSVESLCSLYGHAKGAQTFVIINTQSWERHELAFVPVAGSRTPVVADAEGRALVAQPVDGGLLVPVSVPSIGYTALSISGGGEVDTPARPRMTEQNNRSSTNAAGRWTRETVSPVSADGEQLENGLLCVKLAPDGTIRSIFDREYSREVLRSPANTLLLWEDYPYSWDAWDISHYYRETSAEQAVLVERSLLESGPLRAMVYQKLSVGVSTIEQWISLEAETKLIKIENRVDWREEHKQLRVAAEAEIQALSATYEIQFGAVSRPAHGNTSWDDAQFEVAGHRFADLSQADYGLGIINDCKYGHYIRNSTIDLTLLRSPKDPDPQADLGNHEFTFGYYPHALDWQSSDLLERAHDLNSPLLVHGVGSVPASPSASHFGIAGGTVKIDAVKRAEEGEGTILRLYETRGTKHRTTLRFRAPVKSVEEVNLLEEEPRSVRGLKSSRGDSFASEIALEFKPFQIRTLRIR